MAKRRRRRHKKMEFSQKLVTVSWAVTVIWIFLSYVLAFIERNPNETVTVALITESLGVTIAYYGYQGLLKTSRNKNGVDKNGVPYRIKRKLDTAGIQTDEDRNAENG